MDKVAIESRRSTISPQVDSEKPAWASPTSAQRRGKQIGGPKAHGRKTQDERIAPLRAGQRVLKELGPNQLTIKQ